MNSMKRQQGQTLGGMILGILIAVVILGGAFWYFNQQKAPFQSEAVTKETLPVPEPEIIVPNDGLDSILHKNPEEWITDGDQTQPNQPVTTPDSGTNKKPEPDELGAFIEKDLAPKDNLIIDAKPVATPPATSAPVVEDKPAAVHKPADTKPTQPNKPSTEKKPAIEKKPDPVKAPVAVAKPAVKAGTLQAGAYRSAAQAEEQKVKLALLGYTANVVKADLGEKGIMYRVRLNVPDAKDTQTDLASKGVDVMVVR